MHKSFGQPKQKRVSQHQFAMVPAPDIPRSVFQRDSTHKTTFNAGYLIPMYVDEILPGDSLTLDIGVFTRVSPNAFVYPVMDNIYLDCFAFFVPMRLLWINFEKFMGERTPNADSSTDYLVPQIVGYGGSTVGSLFDYMGIPSDGQVTGTININALPFRAYNKIYNDWFRDENMQSIASLGFGDGPDPAGNYLLKRRGKRHDYFTAALPFAQKGNPVTIPLGTQAPVRTQNTDVVSGAQTPVRFLDAAAGTNPSASVLIGTNSGPDTGLLSYGTNALSGAAGNLYPSNLYADLSQATAAHINTLRQAAAMQQYLERDARGGTRYVEKIWNHFRVRSSDARLQRSEYIGGGSSVVNVNPVAQTAPTQEGVTPLGQLGGVGTGFGNFRATYSAEEHGYLLVLVSVRADLTYQQGLERLWTRSTVYDFPWPTFAHLGEQAVYRREIYATGTAGDDVVFGYQPRYDEMRYKPSQISGRFRSGVAGTLDAWHLAQNFTAPPVLGPTFIEENPPMARVLAGGDLSTTNSQQFLCDAAFRCRHVRPLPMFGTPGLRRF